MTTVSTLPHVNEAAARLLHYIAQYKEQHGYAPCFREIATDLGYSSKSVVSYHLRLLEEEGYLTRTPAVSRSLQLTEKGQRHAQ